MNKYGLVVKKIGQHEKTNFSFLIGQRSNKDFLITLFDETFAINNRFLNENREKAIKEMYKHIRQNVGELFEVFEIPNDPLLIAMLNNLKRDEE